MVTIKLRNGMRFDATPLPDDLFQVVLASGRTKIYPLSDVKVVEGEDNIDEGMLVPIETENKEEKKMKIFHYLLKHTFKEEAPEIMVRVVTTNPPPHVEAAYYQSLKDKMPVGGLYALETGTWRFPFLEDVLGGCDFTVMVVPNALLEAVDNNKLLSRSSFAFANATYTHYFKVEGALNFSANVFKVLLKMAKKSSKRAMEFLRMAEMSLYLTGDEQMSTVDWNFPEVGGDPIYYDGKTYISRRFAQRLANSISNDVRRRKVKRLIREGKLVQVTIRGVTPYGLLKGDAIIVPTKQLNGHDIVTVSDNIKTEMISEDFMHFTMWVHDPMHHAVHDVQSFEDFQEAFTADAWIKDIWRFAASIMKIIDKGEIPSFLMLSEDARNGDGTPNMEKLSASINQTWVRWQVYGHDIRTLQNPMMMTINGAAVKRMSTPKVNGYHKKMWTPMSNAALLTVVTWESATRMGNFTFPNQRKDEVFYDPRVGLVIPGDRFQQTYNLHGGWDLDDSVKVLLVKMWTSDPNVINLHHGKTIANDVVVPTNKDNARLMALLVRSPNGPGEWSMEKVNADSIPIPEEMKTNDLTVVDLAKMPLPQDVLLSNTTCRGLTFTTKYSGLEMTLDDANEMVNAQVLNPGIGRFCNAMMVWSSEQPGFPPEMLDRMENIVDTSQQGFDATAFVQIGGEADRIIDQLKESGVTKVDAALAFTRMSSSQREGFRFYIGRLTTVHREYQKAMELIREKILNFTLQTRANQPEVIKARSRQFPQQVMDWVAQFHFKYTTSLASTDKMFDADKVEDPFTKMMVQHYHKTEMENIVREMVELFNSFSDIEVRNLYMRALWKYILTPVPGAPWGQKDRIICQPGAAGEMCLMDILHEALS